MREEPILEVPDHIKALPEEEQGPALVDAIHRRKQLAQAWEYYGSIPAPTYDPFKATKEKLAELAEDTGKAQYTRRLNGPSSLQVWIDEAQEWRDAHAASEWDEVFDQSGRLSSVSVEFQCADVSDDFMALMLGYNSADELRKDRQARQHLWNQVDDMLARPVDAPPVDVDSVRWPSHNRKLFARRDDKTSELMRILGIEGE